MSLRSIQPGFTLIELSIVLVIIGLIVGGVLVGQDLIRAASVRAQISQIEKFNAAVNTFRGKYGYLPGDIKDPEASSFGFIARAPYPGAGDGNGIIDSASNLTSHAGNVQQGEAAMFWLDLSQASLISEGVYGASPAVSGAPYGGMPFSPITANTYPSLSMWFPTAKLQSDSFVQVYSNGGVNYFALSSITFMVGGGGIAAFPTIPVRSAAAIDGKIDDGLPQTGNVTAQYIQGYPQAYYWAGASDTSATPASPTTCYDNGNTAGGTQKYSVAQNNGAGPNCALSFKLQ